MTLEEALNPNNPGPVLVTFPLDEETWNTVVVDSEENMSVEREGSDDFLVEYESTEDFSAAVRRFDGMIEFRVGA